MARPYDIAKRICDVCASLLGLVLLSWLLLIVYLLVRCTSRGPGLFIQRRVGKDGRVFPMLKFRTMRAGHVHDPNPAVVIADADADVTAVGRFLRRHRLDELPQLLNVLAGQMSLVGPRPTVPEQVEEYDDFQRQRLAVPQGITGLAQVNGETGLTWPERIEWDVYYVRHRSLGLDLRILVRTAAGFLTGSSSRLRRFADSPERGRKGNGQRAMGNGLASSRRRQGALAANVKAGKAFRMARQNPCFVRAIAQIDGNMASLDLKTTHKPVVAYYEALAQFGKLGVTHEGAVRSAFQGLLEHCARQAGRTLVPEYSLKRKDGKSITPDGAIVDSLSQVLRYGLWEAKDTADDLEKEIKVKFRSGYPRDNILFQDPCRAILYQNGELLLDADLTQPGQLVHVLNLFFSWRPPAFDEWEKAVEEFKSRVRELGENLARLIRNERQGNTKYRNAFADFLTLCRAALNPNLSESAVEEMIIQHLLTERIFRKVFDIGDFMQRNVIAREIEKVIDALTIRAFSRDEFVRNLDHFYIAIERAAETISDFPEKQRFLNTVYERFFQGFCVKLADTHGIVYTPQPLVDFMVASAEHVLGAEFGTSLSDRNVHILDPFTGTGNFIVNVMRRIPKSALPHKYGQELHCNEVMLLPYYVASMNIEHAFWEATGSYQAFEGICLVDTFETAESKQGQLDIFNQANTERVERQRRAPIKVILANPPYNAGQVNENDNNKNRKYPEIDRRVRATYGADSLATLVRKLSDPYVKAIRYAADRIGEAGVVCYVNNDSFVAEKTFDGMRKHLARDFDAIYVLDLGGNVRKHPTLSGTTHNVFGIQVGVSINLFVRLPKADGVPRRAKIHYHAVPVEWRRQQKYEFLNQAGSVAGVKWRTLKADARHNWLTSKADSEYAELMPLGSKEFKANGNSGLPAIFHTYSLGVSTNRDSVVYGFDKERLAERVEEFADEYNAELHRWRSKAHPPTEPGSVAQYVDEFVRYDRVKWSETLKRHLVDQTEAVFDPSRIRESLYRPFTWMHLYNARLFVDRPGRFREIFPTRKSESANQVILVPSPGARSPFWCLIANRIPNLNFVSIDSAQCFPRYTYSEDGTRRHENIPTSALQRFQKHYRNKAITRADIFRYIYALLHHPEYRVRYAENLKQELPRVPLVGNAAEFRSFASAGRRLLELHAHYERQKPYPLDHVENPDAKLDWRVETMKPNKEKNSLKYNEFLTLAGIPVAALEYRLGNRSALEWVVDQYRVARDEQGNITDDPNRPEDEQYIVRLIGQVITVSLETMKVVGKLPPLGF